MIAFMKKELMENIRTHKLLILVIVFALFGFMSPLFAKLTPDLLKMFDLNSEALGIGVPSAIDSWAQFFKNIGQMGIIILVIVYSGVVANEFNKGTLINILTKGIKRYKVIISKFIVSVSIWTLVYFISFAITAFYTSYFFDTSIVNNLFLAIISLWFFGLFLISLIILGGILFKNIYGSLLLPAIIWTVLGIASIISKFAKFNPITLLSSLGLLNKTIETAIFYNVIVITVILIIVNISLSIIIFNKQEI